LNTPISEQQVTKCIKISEYFSAIFIGQKIGGELV